MTRVPRYGDEGTIVTTREKAVAALFIVGIAALLLGRVVTGPEERAGTNAQARAATPAPSQTRAADTGSDDTRAAHFHAAATGHD